MCRISHFQIFNYKTLVARNAQFHRDVKNQVGSIAQSFDSFVDRIQFTTMPIASEEEIFRTFIILIALEILI